MLRKNFLHYLSFGIVTFAWVTMLFSVSGSLFAQHVYFHDEAMDFIELPNNIEGNEVQDIHQDQDGYMWFASKAGLVRYNGRNYEVYDHRQGDSTSISSNEVEVIFESRSGDFWIGTWGGGLNKMDRSSGTFTRYQAPENGESGLSNDFVADIVEDADGYLWIATRNGLNRLDPQTERFRHFFPREGDEQSLSHYEVRCLYVDSRNTLWVGTGYPWAEDDLGGLNRYHPSTERFTRYLHSADDPNSITNNKVTAIYEDEHQSFWVGTVNNGLHRLNRGSGSFEYLHDLSTFNIELEAAHIRSIFPGDEGSLWLLSYGCGLKNFDPKTGELRSVVYRTDSKNRTFFPLNYAWELYLSRDGTLWFCTGDVGEKVLKSNNILPHNGMVYMTDDVLAIEMDSISGQVWVGRRANGLRGSNWKENHPGFTWLDNPQEPELGNWSVAPSREDNFQTFNNISVLLPDEAGIVWFGKNELAEGLYRLDPQERQLENFRYDPADENSLSGDLILDISEDPDGEHIWICTEDGGLHRMHKQSRTIERINANLHPNCPLNPELLFFSEAATFWLASIEEGRKVQITEFDYASRTFTKRLLLEMPEADNSISIVGLKESWAGDLWLATDLHLFQIKPDGEWESYPLPQEVGLARSFLFDRQQNIWLATTKGIVVFNHEAEDFQLISEAYQLDAMPFQKRAATYYANNEMFFCGRGGSVFVNSVTVDRYYNNRNRTQAIASEQIQLASFLLNGVEIEHGALSADSIARSRQINLTHEQNNFSLELALLDFYDSEHNRFEYYLEGYDNYWRQSGDKNTAYYSQIPPGDYSLRIRGYNAMGISGEAVPLRIAISPPWWQSWWAYTIYLLLTVSLVYMLYRVQLGRQIAQSETQRLQELDVAKSQLYTNITHEFRTPLTVILGMAKQLEGRLAEPQNLMVEMIDRNGQNLLNLVNQMLDLAKLESGQLSLQLQQSDIITYLKYLVESFHSFAESREVKIHFLSDLETQKMDFDPGKIQQIMSNLLSNAVKFTPSGGDIYISVEPLKEQQQLSIKVKDTGIGIAPDRLPYIFQRFYQADDSYTREFPGTGIGLALVAELMKLMNGVISVRSDLGKGTEISLILPISQQAEQSFDFSYFHEAKLQFYREGVAPEEEAIISTLEGGQKPKLLVVEDNFDVRAYIRACLSDRFHLLTAENGQRGVEKAIQHIPDFIISDVMMPLKDGYSLVKELKADHRTSHIPIILLTAKADIDSKLEGLEQGADAYLAKPFNPKELLIRINKLIELRHQLQVYYLEQTNSQIAEPTTPMELENAFVQEVSQIITEHLDDAALDVQLICKKMAMSHSQLHRKLSALTGLSTNKFIRHIRLTKAKKMLRNPKHSITAVAYETGYRDPSYFGRIFKQETGKTPAEWRREVA
ncbi:MAG: two-component regulator propeller domain-containing protein [Bacteroidota bacterium]